MNAYMPGEAWRKSSHSGANNDCIEVGGRPGAVAVRDTKDPHGPALAFAPADARLWLPFNFASFARLRAFLMRQCL